MPWHTFDNCGLKPRAEMASPPSRTPNASESTKVDFPSQTGTSVPEKVRTDYARLLRKEMDMTVVSHILSLAFYTLGAAFYAVQLCLIVRKERNKSKDL